MKFECTCLYTCEFGDSVMPGVILVVVKNVKNRTQIIGLKSGKTCRLFKYVESACVCRYTLGSEVTFACILY